MSDSEGEPLWHREWRAAIERVIAAQMMRDATKAGTERQVADQEYEVAM
jgi:hypothetical protein